MQPNPSIALWHIVFSLFRLEPAWLVVHQPDQCCFGQASVLMECSVRRHSGADGVWRRGQSHLLCPVHWGWQLPCSRFEHWKCWALGCPAATPLADDGRTLGSRCQPSMEWAHLDDRIAQWSDLPSWCQDLSAPRLDVGGSHPGSVLTQVVRRPPPLGEWWKRQLGPHLGGSCWPYHPHNSALRTQVSSILQSALFVVSS